MKMLMGENGPVEPQVGYVDGYHFGERLLEGVIFRIVPSEDGSKLICIGTPGFELYMDKFNEVQISKWYQQAAEHAMQNECQDEENSQDLYWEEPT